MLKSGANEQTSWVPVHRNIALFKPVQDDTTQCFILGAVFPHVVCSKDSTGAWLMIMYRMQLC